MTVIFSTEIIDDQVVFGGDIIVSVDNISGNRKTIFPLFPYMSQFSTENGEISGLRQKIQRVTDNLFVLWAGSRIVSRSIVSMIKELEYPGDLLGNGLDDMLSNSGLSPEELESVSLIVVMVIPGFSVEVVSHNCNKFNRNYVDYIASGSGAWHMFEYLSGQVPISFENRLVDAMFDVIERIARQTISEGMTKETLEYFYGGKIQLFFASRHGIEHITPTIKIWDYKDDVLYGLPAYICNIQDNKLVLTICDSGDAGGHKQMLQFSIPELDGNQTVQILEPTLFWSAVTIIHIITSDKNNVCGYILQTVEDDYKIEYRNGTFEEIIKDEFKQRILQCLTLTKEEQDFLRL